MATDNPSTQSSDREAMTSYLEMVESITGGLEAMKEAGEKYLPRFEHESLASHGRRIKTARMTNVFADILNSLSMMPFETPVQLTENTSEPLRDLAENIDEHGSSLSAFSAKLFHNALRDGVTWVLVDYTKEVPKGATIAEEKQAGARPFWAHYRAADVLAVYTERSAGMERVVEARLREVSVERDGFKEVEVERVRVLRHEEGSTPTWELWRKSEGGAAGGNDWEIEEGPEAMDIDVIPLVPITFGQRRGNGWKIEPPLRDAAYLQIELYQQENGLKNIRTFSAYPMLAANGLAQPRTADGEELPLVVGPGRVLWGGVGPDGTPTGKWEWLEPAGQSLAFLRQDVADTIKELRELGRQPLTAQSGNLTVITTAVAAKKGSAAIQAWVGLMVNALENCFDMTARWLNIENYEVGIMVHEDFDLGIGDDASFKYILEMARDPDPLISRTQATEEARRRGILGARYDPDLDSERIDSAIFKQDEE